MNTKAVCDRIDLIAHERGLSESEIAKAKTCTDDALLEFAERHDLSINWLVSGDLQGLKRMVRRGST
jgi:hypothetical protein